ncbi:hypothetical protein O0882_08080 [Janthinobacterium sp. SUN073]|uniref:hypothetical protein n=1 Tax=Janthinobacterium sp. SUN073 TaxID=3004102 RepID=UPI0025AF8B67|nr:hypothetical protein [Janthinobacterium sp. SUN073]MDN2696270.1 hypothetical protein [Janthinobacterium sp. SUN073]
MKILLVEDDTGKREDIQSQVKLSLSQINEKCEITEKESLRSAWRTLIAEKFDLLLLDMSLPSSDVSDDSAPNEPESFAGREILDQMRLRSIHTPVLVVTQYRTFERGTISLEQLVAGFEAKYAPFFRGYIYYNASSDDWRRQLNAHLQEIIK